MLALSIVIFMMVWKQVENWNLALAVFGLSFLFSVLANIHPFSGCIVSRYLI